MFACEGGQALGGFGAAQALGEGLRCGIARRRGASLLKDPEVKAIVIERCNAVEVKLDKMSKSKYNVVNPDDMCGEYGADAMRMYELFMGPLEAVKPWSMKGVEGVYRFLARAWRISGEVTSSPDVEWKTGDVSLRRMTHRLLKDAPAFVEAYRRQGTAAAKRHPTL